MVSVVSGTHFDAKGVATEFVKARRAAGSFVDYPGTLPPDLDSAYRCQDEAIALWDDSIAGWKVGWIPEPFSEKYGAQRLVGPIFKRGLRHANGSAVLEAPVFAQGFAAIEAEFVFQLAKDAPANVTEWTAETARRFVKTMFIGIEIASSPLATLNDLGPGAVISDFGNNWGVVVGPTIRDWRTTQEIVSLTFVDDSLVGRGTAFVRQGALGALAFTLGKCARRGRPLRAGDVISTGMITGVHDIRPGQVSRHVFEGCGEVQCRAIRATG